VAGTAEGDARLAAGVAALVPGGAWGPGEWAAEVATRTGEPYARAALEAAAVDLACRQAVTSPFVLAGVPPRPVRYVVSFDRRAGPPARMRRPPPPPPRVPLPIDPPPPSGHQRP